MLESQQFLYELHYAIYHAYGVTRNTHGIGVIMIIKGRFQK